MAPERSDRGDQKRRGRDANAFHSAVGRINRLCGKCAGVDFDRDSALLAQPFEVSSSTLVPIVEWTTSQPFVIVIETPRISPLESI
jgi:hypothetical protein